MSVGAGDGWREGTWGSPPREASRMRKETREAMLEVSLRVSGEARGAWAARSSVRAWAKAPPISSWSSRADRISQESPGMLMWLRRSGRAPGEDTGEQVKEVSSRRRCGGVEPLASRESPGGGFDASLGVEAEARRGVLGDERTAGALTASAGVVAECGRRS